MTPPLQSKFPRNAYINRSQTSFLEHFKKEV